MKKLNFILLFFFAIGTGLVLNNQKSLAVTAADWKPGRIIDDVVFQNKQSMTVQQIQQFLDSKVPACDRWGTKPMWVGGPSRAQWSADNGKDLAPYTCLKEYVENPTTKANNGADPTINVPGGLSAAQLIYNAAQAQNINPQVFLVLLQKEQSLVTDDWPYAKQFERATGNNCPDTAPCDPSYAWLWTQVNNAGAQFNYYVTHFDQYNYAPGWNNILYNPNVACGRQSVFIENAYTAALYIYTPYVPNQAALNNLYGTGDSCSAYGNRNFWRLFSDWFGGTLANSTTCDSQVASIACVWSLRKPDGSQFLTSSRTEFINAITMFGWINEGVAFYSSPSQVPNTIPVYRLRSNSSHYYTSDQSDYESRIATQGWADEGVAFYAYAPSVSLNASKQVYRLFKSSGNLYYLTIDPNKRDSLISLGYSVLTSPFNTFSGMVSLPLPSSNRNNVYSLRNGTRYIYTTNINEVENAIRLSYVYDRVLTTSSVDLTGLPVYRLQTQNGYFYTTDVNEKSLAASRYGMNDEGVVYYLDDASQPVYRMFNSPENRHYYTNNFSEVMSLSNLNGWRFEGLLYNITPISLPVYRFLNTVTGKHFYTISAFEAAKITNTSWKYEGQVFIASPTSGDAVYRLRYNDKYFFTNNLFEKDIAVSRYGYVYEGIAFYTSSTPTSSPIYRLQGRNDEYFYTTSSQEKDTAVSRYGYVYEGIGLYATASP